MIMRKTILKQACIELIFFKFKQFQKMEDDLHGGQLQWKIMKIPGIEQNFGEVHL